MTSLGLGLASNAAYDTCCVSVCTVRHDMMIWSTRFYDMFDAVRYGVPSPYALVLVAASTHYVHVCMDERPNMICFWTPIAVCACT